LLRPPTTSTVERMQTTANCIKGVCRAFGPVTTVIGLLLVLRWLTGVAGSVLAPAATGAPTRADELLTGLAAGASALLVLWTALAVLLELLARLPGVVGDAARTVSAVVTPRVLRRSVAVVLGVGMAAGLAPGASVAAAPAVRGVATSTPLPDPAFAPLPDPGWSAPHEPAAPSRPSHSPVTAPTGTGSRAAARPPAGVPSEPTAPAPSVRAAATPAPSPLTTATPSHTAPDPGWVPGPPTVRPQPDVRLLGHRPAPAEAGLEVVRRGDTLWSIAARHLGGHPSDAEVARAWPVWHDANRGVIGDDPDLILPGQVLRSPGAAAS
jgi:nucleoid-associated protein YgaU